MDDDKKTARNKLLGRAMILLLGALLAAYVLATFLR
jgi:hypothetical protein